MAKIFSHKIFRFILIVILVILLWDFLFGYSLLCEEKMAESTVGIQSDIQPVGVFLHRNDEDFLYNFNLSYHDGLDRLHLRGDTSSEYFVANKSIKSGPWSDNRLSTVGQVEEFVRDLSQENLANIYADSISIIGKDRYESVQITRHDALGGVVFKENHYYYRDIDSCLLPNIVYRIRALTFLMRTPISPLEALSLAIGIRVENSWSIL